MNYSIGTQDIALEQFGRIVILGLVTQREVLIAARSSAVAASLSRSLRDVSRGSR